MITIKNVRVDFGPEDMPQTVELSLDERTKSLILLAASKAKSIFPESDLIPTIAFPSYGSSVDGGPIGEIRVGPENFNVTWYNRAGDEHGTDDIPFESFGKQRFLLWDEADGDVLEYDEETDSCEVDDFVLVHADNLEEAIEYYLAMKKEIREGFGEYQDEEE